jgi:hypothetical protein
MFLKFLVPFRSMVWASNHGGGGGGSLEPRTAIEGSFSAWGSLGKLDRGLGRGETFFPDSDSDRYSDRDSDETFQISRKLGLLHVEFFCLLDSQPCSLPPVRSCILFGQPFPRFLLLQVGMSKGGGGIRRGIVACHRRQVRLFSHRKKLFRVLSNIYIKKGMFPLCYYVFLKMM